MWHRNYERFWEDGYLILSEQFKEADIAVLHDEVGRIVRPVRTLDAQRFADPYARAFTGYMNPTTQSEIIKAFVHQSRIGRIAADLLGSHSVRLSHSFVFWKPAGAERTPLHADQYSWPITSEWAVSIWVPLQPTDAEDGSLIYYKGSHKKLQLRNSRLISPNDERMWHFILAGQFTARLAIQVYLTVLRLPQRMLTLILGFLIWFRRGISREWRPDGVLAAR